MIVNVQIPKRDVQLLQRISTLISPFPKHREASHILADTYNPMRKSRMDDANSSTRIEHDEEFHDCLDDFPFYDCVEDFGEPIESFADASVLAGKNDSTKENKGPPQATLRRRRSYSHRKSTGAESIELSKVSSSAGSDNYLNSREKEIRFTRNRLENEKKLRNAEKSASSETRCESECLKGDLDGEKDEKNEEHSTLTVGLENRLSSREKKLRFSRNVKECEKKLRISENSASSEIRSESECSRGDLGGEKDEKNVLNEEHCTVTDTSNDRAEDLVRNESNTRESNDTNSNLLLILVDIVIKCITFQIYLFVSIFTFPISLACYLYMLVFNPFALLKRCREYLVQKVKRLSSVLCESVSPFVYEWLKEHQQIWKLGLQIGWGLLWSGYVCFVLVGLLVTAFVMGGILIRVVVEEPIRIQRSLNFDYTEKSPVAFVPIMAPMELSHDIYLAEKAETWKSTRSRVIPFNHKWKVTVSLTLPESDYNQNLGIFQVRVDFLSADGKTLASSRRPCMLHFRSQPIRLLLTFLKIAPILTGYTSETQNLKINFRGFTEGETPTACLRVVMEQRAQYLPGAGIPEIYGASLSLESELPLLKKVLWFWKKTLFVWISMTIFSLELVFALLCCKPIVIPKIRLREANNREALPNDRARLS